MSIQTQILLQYQQTKFGPFRVRVDRLAFYLAIFSNLIWGTSFLASKITLTLWGPFTSSVLRFILALIAMLFIFPLFNRSIAIPKSFCVWKKIFLVGFSGFGLLYPFQLAGLSTISSSLSASIMLSSPLFVLFLSTGVFGEPMSLKKLSAIGIGIFGGLFLLHPSYESQFFWNSESILEFMKGTFFTFVASVSLAVSVLATKSATKDLDSPSLVFWSTAIGVLLILPFALFERQPEISSTQITTAILALLYLAIICSVTAFLSWNYAITLSSPQKIASTMHIKTPTAILIGVALGQEPITHSVVIGTALISFAVWLSQRPTEALIGNPGTISRIEISG